MRQIFKLLVIPNLDKCVRKANLKSDYLSDVEWKQW